MPVFRGDRTLSFDEIWPFLDVFSDNKYQIKTKLQGVYHQKIKNYLVRTVTRTVHFIFSSRTLPLVPEAIGLGFFGILSTQIPVPGGYISL